MKNQTATPLPSNSPPPTSTCVLVAYAAPALASSFLFTAISLYLLKFSTDVLLMAPASVGLIFGLGRFWDALTDPLVGQWSDRTRSPLGRRRPWMMAAALPVAAATVAIWSPPASLEGDALSLWMGGSVLLFYTAITCFSVPYHALGAELSTDHHDRSRIFGAKAFAEHLGIIAGAVSLLVMENSGAPRLAATGVAGVGAVLLLGGIAWVTGTLREPAHHQGRGGRKGAHRAFADVIRNPAARILVAVFFLEMLGYQTFVTLLPYLTEYVLETPGATAYYLFGAIATTLLTLPLWVPLSRRFGKVPVWRASLALKTVIFAGIAVAGAGDWPWIAALTCLFGLVTGGGAVLGPSLKADVVDSDEALTGDRKEGTFFAAWGLAIKLSIAFAIAISGFGLSAIGFVANQQQEAEAIQGIRLLVAVVPVVCHLLALWLLGRLQMDADVHARIRQAIDSRAAQSSARVAA